MAKAISKLATRDDRIFGYAVGWNQYSWILLAGGDYFVDNARPVRSVMASQDTMRGVQFVLDMMYKYRICPTMVEAQSIGGHEDMFKLGKIGMIIDGHWMVPDFNRKIKDFQWDTQVLPRGKVRAIQNMGSCYSIPRLSKRPDLAYKFIEFMSGPQGQEILIRGGTVTPVLKNAKIMELFLKGSGKNEQAFLEMTRSMKPTPFTPQYEELMSTVNREMDLVWLAKEPPGTVLPRLAAEMEKIVK